MKRICLFTIFSYLFVTGAAFPQNAQNGQSGQDLSSQATDPTASLMSFNFIQDFHTSFYGIDDSGFEFRFQPVIPFRAWGQSNILRIVIPYQTSGPGPDGLKSVSIFDLLVLPRSWGRLGFGPVMSLEESNSPAPGKFSIEPAFGAVIRSSRRLNIGAFNQNLFGDDFAITQIQPIIAYQLGKGWALTAGDAQFIYDWKAEQWVSVPIGAQIGVVRSIAGQPFRFAVNPQWNFKDITGAIESKIVFTVTLLAPLK